MLWDHFLVRKEEKFQKRIIVVGSMILIVVGLILLRLLYLQIFRGEYYRDMSARNRVRLVPIKAQRGMIFDRNQEVLVTNVSTFTVSLIPASLPDSELEREKIYQLLQQLLQVDPEEIRTKVKRRRFRYFEPIRIKQDLDRETATRVEEFRPQLPGVVVLAESRRNYKNGSLAFHALGYVGEISDTELALREGYQAGDIIGQAGVEKVYDHYLKGRNGWFHIEVDAMGRQKGILGQETPWPGHNLVLSLDRKLQEKAEAILIKQRGVIVVEDVRTGGILALASSPTFDPNNFANGISRADWDKLRQDTDFPLTNRAIQGLYPPGSIFKIVTMTAALEEKVVTPEHQFECKGIFWISTWPYRCWKDSGHGWVNAYESIVQSCDVFYYHLGLKLKVDKLAKWARSYGYGWPSGLDLPNEVSGLVPSAQWKVRTQNMPWFPGNTVMMSIGQGYILSTPMQMLNTIVAVANQGVIYRPHLLKEVRTKSGRLIHEIKPEVMFHVNAAPETWSLIRRGLLGVVQNKKGTGKTAAVVGIKVAGKTATAQNPHGEDHAGFVAYAPADDPQIALLIYLENAGGGGAKAAPLARELMEEYFGVSSEESVEEK